MSDLDLRLRITADGGVAVVESGKVKGALKEVGQAGEQAAKAATAATRTWHDFIKERMGPLMRQFAAEGVSHAEAHTRAIRKIAEEWKSVKGAGAGALKDGANAASNFSQTITVASSAIRGFARGGAIAAAVGAATALVIRRITDEAVQAQIQLDKMSASLRFSAGGDQAAGAREMDYVRQKSFELGAQLNDTALAYAKLTASSRGTQLEGQQTREIFEAITGAGTVMGLSMQEQSGALLAVSQMMSKGTVQSEELRGQLGERLPGAFQIAARAMGVTTQQLSKMLEQGQVIADEFLPKFAAQLKKELGGEVAKAAANAQAEVNRLDSTWQNLKQQFAQTGAAEAGLIFMRSVRDAADEVAVAMEKARKQGAGFWGQMGAAVLAGFTVQDGQARGGDLANDPQSMERATRRLRDIGLELSALGTSMDELGPHAYELKERARALRATIMEPGDRQSEASARSKRGASEWMGEGGREAEMAAHQKLHDLRLKLLGEYGDKKARFEREWAEAEIALQGASAEVVAEIRAKLYEKIYGADAKQKGEAHYREMIALEEGQQRILAANQEARVAAVKMALDQDLISQRQYYASVAELEQHALETRRLSVQRQLDAAQGSKDPAKAADVARYKAELEQLAAEEQQIAARKNAAILKLDEQLADDRLAVQRELHRKELSAVDAWVAEFQKKHADKMKKALEAGNQGMVDDLMALFRAGLESAEFTDAKRVLDSLLAGFKEQLAEIRDDAEETDGLVGMLQAGEAGLELRNKFLPELQRALDKLRELAANNPALKPIVAAATREVTRASAESIAVWRGMVNDFVGIWRDGAAAAVAGGKPAFIQWIRDLRTRIASGIAQYLAEIFARRYALNFVANMAEGALGKESGLAVAARAAAGANNVSVPGELMNAGIGAVGTGLSWAGNAMGWTGLANFGAGMGLSTAAVGTAAIDAGVGVAATSAAGVGSYAAAAIPYVGWVIAAYMILSSLLDDGPENPNLTMRQGTGGRGAFGGLDFTGTMAGGDMSAFYRMIGGVDEAALRVLSPEQQGRVTQRLGDFTRGGRRTDGQPLEMAFGEGEDAGEPIALELLRSRYAAVFDEISPRAAAAIRAFQGTSQELHRLITTMLSVQEVVQSAGGRLDWFTNIMSDFATSSEAVQQAAGQMIGYLATDITAMFDEAANGPRTAYASWFRLGDQVRDWTDLSERGIVQLGQLTQQRYQAEIELVRQITSAVEDVDAMFSDTIREITLMTLDTPARYDFIRAETDELMRQVGVTNDPELLREMSQQINANLRELFGMLDPATQRARLGEYTTYLGDANDVVQQRLAAARAHVEAERNTALATSVATAIENALKEFAEKQRLAAADFAAGASNFNESTTRFSQSVDRGIRITIDGREYSLTEVNGGDA